MVKIASNTILGSLIFSFLCVIAAVLVQQPLLLLLPFVVVFTIASLYYTKLSWYTLLVTLPLSTETSITSTLSLDLPDEGLMILCSVVFFLQLAIKAVSIPKSLLSNRIAILLLISFFWYCISAIFSTDIVLSAKFMLAKVWYIIPFVVMPTVYVKTKKDLLNVAICLLAAAFFTVVVILYKHSSSRFLFDTINNAVAPFYRNHVNYAALIVCILPIGIALFFYVTHIVHKRILFGIFIILIFALAVSYSRGAWLAIGTGAVSIFLIKRKWIAFSFIGFLIICIGIAYWLANKNTYIQYHPNYKKTIYHANFNDHINATFKGTDLSNAERFNRWIAGVRMVDEGKLTGFGPNTFYNNYKPYIVTYFKTWVSDNPEKSTVHNYFLLTLIEQGWTGFVLLLLLIFFVYRCIENGYTNAVDSFYKNVYLIIGIIFTMLLTLNFLSDLVETDKIGSLYYLCMGLLVSLSRRTFHKKTTIG